jgi:hypothetical protein
VTDKQIFSIGSVIFRVSLFFVFVSSTLPEVRPTFVFVALVLRAMITGLEYVVLQFEARSSSKYFTIQFILLRRTRRISITKRRQIFLCVWRNSSYLFSESYTRKLHNEELHNLHSSPSIIKMIKSRM